MRVDFILKIGCKLNFSVLDIFKKNILLNSKNNIGMEKLLKLIQDQIQERHYI